MYAWPPMHLRTARRRVPRRWTMKLFPQRTHTERDPTAPRRPPPVGISVLPCTAPCTAPYVPHHVPTKSDDEVHDEVHDEVQRRSPTTKSNGVGRVVGRDGAPRRHRDRPATHALARPPSSAQKALAESVTASECAPPGNPLIHALPAQTTKKHSSDGPRGFK